MAKKKKGAREPVSGDVATNRRARHKFELIEKLEAEIERLLGKTAQKGLTLIPTRIYFKGPRAKVELALARSKEGRDRRREIAERDVRREVEREFKGRMR
jgi:tmRNA-binding protein